MQLTPQPFKSVFPNVDSRVLQWKGLKRMRRWFLSELEELVHSAGTTWQDYANCDQDLATTNTIEDNWEEMLLPRAKQGTVTNQIRKRTMKALLIIHQLLFCQLKLPPHTYLCQLREFAMSHRRRLPKGRPMSKT